MIQLITQRLGSSVPLSLALAPSSQRSDFVGIPWFPLACWRRNKNQSRAYSKGTGPQGRSHDARNVGKRITVGTSGFASSALENYILYK